MNKKLSIALLGACFTLSICFAQTTAQWRGANRDGQYTETQLLKTWPENGPSMLWSNDSIGDGYGSVAIDNNRIFVNGEIDSISQVFAFNTNGKLLWKTPNGKEFIGSGFTNKFAGARSTPTVTGDLVYACSGIGRIICLDVKTGKEKWAVDMLKQFGGIMGGFGYSESLLLDGDKLFCFPGGTEKNAVALNRFTGEAIWVSKVLGDTISYCSPMLIKLPTRNVVVNMTNYYIFGLDAATGELLWSHKQEKVERKQQCNTPIFADGYIYYLAGDGNGAVKLELSVDGKTIKEIWRYSNVKNNFNGFVKMGNFLFAAEKAQKMKCIDSKTGIIADSAKIGNGVVIAADGMLYFYSDKGDINLIQINDSKMNVTGKLKITKGTKEHFAHLAISKGVLYVRHGKSLMAYDIKGQ